VRTVPKRTLGLIMAFGAGVLFSSVAYELVEEAVEIGGQLPMAAGLATGALVFFAGSKAIDRLGAEGMGSVSGPSSPDSGLAIVLGAALDGVPESIVLGLTIAAGGGTGVAFLVAVVISNLPEGIAGTAGLRAGGWDAWRIIRLWLIVVAASAVAAFIGATVLAGGQGELRAFILGFAGGAILTMLSDTLVPEAFENAGDLAGLLTTLGFGLAFGLVAARLGRRPPVEGEDSTTSAGRVLRDDGRDAAGLTTGSARLPAEQPLADQQDAKGHDQHDRGDRVGRRRDALPDLAEHVQRDGRRAAAVHEGRDQVVVEGERERQQEAGHDRRQELRERDLPERPPRRREQVVTGLDHASDPSRQLARTRSRTRLILNRATALTMVWYPKPISCPVAWVTIPSRPIVLAKNTSVARR
jgi:ZIP family zinc transporter